MIVLETKAKWKGSGFLSRARLREECIEFVSLSFKGRAVQTIDLADIVRTEWWTSVPGTPNARLHLQGGNSFVVWLESPGIWKAELATRTGEALGKAKLPEGRRSVRSAA